MVRILWFKETTRWSRRGIPLKVVWVSPRQLVILALSFFVGYSVGIPLQGPTFKLVTLGTALLAGVVVSFWRVKMLRPEGIIRIMMGDLTASLRSRIRMLWVALNITRLRRRFLPALLQ